MPKLKDGLNKKMRSMGFSANGSGREVAQAAAAEMVRILTNEIKTLLDSGNAQNRLISAIRSSVQFNPLIGWTVQVYFDKDIAHSKSLSNSPKYKMGA